MSENPSFWRELKERRVIRVAVLYLAVGWVVFEGSETLTGVLELPAVTPRLVFAIVALGFPLAVTLAWAFQVTSSGVERTGPFAGTAAGSRMPFLGGLAVGVLSVAGVAFVFFGPRGDAAGPDGTELDEDFVAVLPFRVSAPDDLSYLGEGLMELLAYRLDGDVGPRSVDPGRVVALARSAGGMLDSDLAASVGAGLLVTGSMIGDGSGLIFNAELRRVSDGSTVAQADVEAHPDSLTAVADRLVGELLSLSAGEYPTSIAQLTSASPEALKAYLLGRQAWYDGRYNDAPTHYDEAIRLDSTFALAGIARADAGNMGTGVGFGGGLALARRHQDRLSPRDLAYLDALSPVRPQTHREQLRTHEQLTRDQPNRVEAWYWLGELRIHRRNDFGPRWAEDVRTAFRRTVDLAPGYFPALDHLVILESQYGTPEDLQAIATEYVLGEPQFPFYGGLASGSGQLSFDRATVLADPDPSSLLYALQIPLYWPDHTPDDFMETMEPAFEETQRRAGVDLALRSVLRSHYYSEIAFGRPSRALAVRDRRIREGVLERFARPIIADATWNGIGAADAREAVRNIDERLSGGAQLSLNDVRDLAAADAWRFVSDPSYRGGSASRRIMDSRDAQSHPVDLAFEAHGLLLEAWSQSRIGNVGLAKTTLQRVDELVREGPHSSTHSTAFVLAMSTIFDELGELERSREILDRRDYAVNNGMPYEVEVWRRVGELSARLGDTERAVKEYERYLRIRVRAEPSEMEEVERVRAELARLRGN